MISSETFCMGDHDHDNCHYQEESVPENNILKAADRIKCFVLALQFDTITDSRGQNAGKRLLTFTKP